MADARDARRYAEVNTGCGAHRDVVRYAWQRRPYLRQPACQERAHYSNAELPPRYGSASTDELHELVTTKWRVLGEAGAFMHEIIGSRFDFSDIVHTLPTELFDDEMMLHVGSKEVRLIELSPAHTRGDALVYVPQDRTVFTGDLLFVGGHPVVRAGPIAN
jgi:glyoxylase-like metal-dependent hydrolase (beta-lactamase superfamily II)